MARALLHGATVRGEMVEGERFGTGERRRLLLNAAPVRDEAGRIVAGVVAELDVTERARAEHGLLETAERVQLALDAGAIVGTWNWHLPTDHFTADERFARSSGLGVERCRAGLGIEAVIANVHPDDLAGLQRAIAEGIARGGPYSYEYRVRRANGEYHWVQANGRVDHAPDGTPLRFPGVLLDVDARRATEERLRRNADSFYELIQNNPFGVYVVDADFRLAQVAKDAENVLANVPRPLIGRDFTEVLRVVWAEPFASEAIGRFRHTLATGEPYVSARHVLAGHGDEPAAWFEGDR
jgi:PAS domain-containing protein